jgi:hypothetical protein
MREHPASEALRTRSSQLLHETLVASLRTGERAWLADSRDLMVQLAPFYDCARRLGVDASDVFRTAAAAGPRSLRDVVTAFGERDDVTVDAFGYAIIDLPEGPSYRFLR